MLYSIQHIFLLSYFVERATTNWRLNQPLTFKNQKN
jgi:hypothetical protein